MNHRWPLGMVLGLLLGLAACSRTFAPAPGHNPGPAQRLSSDTGGATAKPQREKNESRARHLGRSGPLSEREMALARVAWKYFENNYQPETGLVNAVHDYPSTTMWDTASSMGGLMAAYELGLITQNEFDRRMVTLLGTLNKLPFFRDELPNKVYHTKTAEKMN